LETNELQNLKKKYEDLEKEYKALLQQSKAKEESMNYVMRDIREEYEKYQNPVLKEQSLKTQLFTWQKIVDEMAHSINTDVYVAVSNLEKHKDLPRVKKAYYHTKQIRDLTNLLMWYIKRDEVPLSGEMTEVNLHEVLQTQLETIKDGISTLRLSADEHEENILKMEVPFTVEGEPIIFINTELKEVVGLLTKDILRNALKNTQEENPYVSISITEQENSINVSIINNISISKEYADWFNNKTVEEPVNISKSMKVGLRVIKMWIDLFSLQVSLIPDVQQKTTTAQLIFPKKVVYEKH